MRMKSFFHDQRMSHFGKTGPQSHQLDSKQLYRLFPSMLPVFLCFAKFISATPTFALDIGSGIVAVEDGDDRLRPAAVLHAASTAGFISRFYLYGRDYGPVSERNMILSLGKRFDLSSKTWQAHFGFAALSDTTTVKYVDSPDDSTSYTSYNAGMGFGIHWNFIDLKAFQMKATWDSHVFPAGYGFIFLANARKSTLGLTGAFNF